MRAGREIKTHTASYDSSLHIPGLSRQGKRWRIVKDGKEIRFTEPDERRAIEKAKGLLGINDHETIQIISDVQPAHRLNKLLAPPTVVSNGVDVSNNHAAIHKYMRDEEKVDGFELKIQYPLPEGILFPWLAEILSKPEGADFIGKKIGIADLRQQLAGASLPVRSIRVSDIMKNYQDNNPITELAKNAAIRAFTRLTDHAQAKTLEELTKAKIHSFRQSIESDKAIQSAGTKSHMYGQIKSLISFGLKNPIMDAAEIRSCLDRCKLLWTADAPPSVDPKPISKENFHKLLTAAEGTTWKAWLLMGLNCAMYLKELCHLEWTAIDLEAGTLTMIRNKTKRDRIPKVAVLWPETVAALKALPRKPTYVFTSPHGTRYASSQSRANAFSDLRKRAEVSEDVSFSHLRDGAYTAACAGTTDERLPKLLAGHSAGMQDAYVLRNPEMVRPACEAVYKKYGPF